MPALPAPPSVVERFPALRQRDFRTLWIGLVFASLTLAFQYYAQMWLIYALTDSALLLGLLGAVRGLAMLLFGLYGGALADRWDRRTLLIVTQTLGLALSLALGLLALAGAVTLLQAFLLIFLGAAAASVDAPVRQALIPELVPREQIPNAVALATAAQMGSFAVTPLLAGFVIDAIGPGGAYLASTVGNLAILAALWALRPRGRPGGPQEGSLWIRLRAGLAYSRGHAVVRAVVLVVFTTSAFGFALFQGPIVKWAAVILRLAPGEYGMLASTWGLGVLVVSSLLSYLHPIPRQGGLFVGASLLFGASFVGFGLTRSLPLAGLAYFVNGAAWIAASITATAIVQQSVPNEVRGRVMSLFTLNAAFAQIAALVLGGLADVVGLERLLPAVTLLCTVLVAVLVLGVPTLRRLDRVLRSSASPSAPG